MLFEFIALIMLHGHFPLLMSFQRICRSPWSCIIFHIKYFYDDDLPAARPNPRPEDCSLSVLDESLFSTFAANRQDKHRQDNVSCQDLLTIIEGLTLGFKARVKKVGQFKINITIILCNETI